MAADRQFVTLGQKEKPNIFEEVDQVLHFPPANKGARRQTDVLCREERVAGGDLWSRQSDFGVSNLGQGER